MFNVSLSAVQAYQQCQARYYYAYVRRLRPVTRDIAPQMGTMLHRYLEEYYSALLPGEGFEPGEAHDRGLAKLDEYQPQITGAISTALTAGRTEEVELWRALLPKTKRLAERYFLARGRDDAQAYEVVLVERKLETEIIPNVINRGVIDLVLRSNETGLTYLVEHKTTTSVPPSSVRLRDLQTLLYSEVLRRRDIQTDAVLWNYIRTKEPTVPEPLKSGGMTRARNIDTTWEVYEQALLDAGLDPANYQDMRGRLDGRELTIFFPRYTHVTVARTDILLQDFAQTAGRMFASHTAWKSGIGRPVRSLSRNCDYCPFNRICEIGITGGDEEDAIKLSYTTEREERV